MIKRSNEPDHTVRCTVILALHYREDACQSSNRSGTRQVETILKHFRSSKINIHVFCPIRVFLFFCFVLSEPRQECVSNHVLLCNFPMSICTLYLLNVCKYCVKALYITSGMKQLRKTCNSYNNLHSYYSLNSGNIFLFLFNFSK